MFGYPADDFSGDINQVTFVLPPARHRCQVTPATPLKVAAGPDHDHHQVHRLRPAVGM